MKPIEAWNKRLVEDFNMSLDEYILEQLRWYADMNQMYRRKNMHDIGFKVDNAAITYICEKTKDKNAHLRHTYIGRYYKYVRGEL